MSMSKLIVERVNGAGALVSIALAGWIIMASVGIPVPMPAWSSEVDKSFQVLNQNISALAKIVITGQINGKKREIAYKKMEIESHQTDETAIPTLVISDLIVLETELEALQAQLKATK